MYAALFSLVLIAGAHAHFENRPARQRFPPREVPPPHDLNKRPQMTPDELSPNQNLENNGATLGRIAMPDGRKATILTYAGILSKSTRLPSYMEITLRQITDGRKVAQAVLGPFDNIMDCDVSFDQDDITRFSEDFMTAQLKVKSNNLTFVPRHGFDQKMERLLDLPDLIRKCHSYQRQTYGQARRGRNVRRRQRSKRSLVFPGTKWCGKGDDASKYTMLGNNAGTDRCCRQHDHCPYTIPGFSPKYGIFNYRFHTVSHCDCDYSFRTCLKMTGSGSANMIGAIYFNVVRLSCFVFVPQRTCVRRSWWGSCEKHEFKYIAEIQDAISYDSRV